MNKLTQMTALGAIAASLAVPISAAQAAIFSVYAINDIPSWLDTGINLNAGTTYNFNVINPATIWSAGSEYPSTRKSTADGINPSYYGQHAFGDLTANYGTLVGQVGSHYFVIGTGPLSLSGLSGLFLRRQLRFPNLGGHHGHTGSLDVDNDVSWLRWSRVYGVSSLVERFIVSANLNA
jgi:hypothetical protein